MSSASRIALRHIAIGLLIGVALLAIRSQRAVAQSVDYVKANYSKNEYRIPMRDGKHLFTAVYAPKDALKAYPVLLQRTPYGVGPNGADPFPADLGPSPSFVRSGYIFAYQDVRGRGMSEGEFVDVRPYKPVKCGPTDIDETTDTWDTIDWLLKNIPNHNGKVGVWGGSYLGFYTNMAAISAHPAIQAVSPQAPVVDWFGGDDWHHNGALFLAHIFTFEAAFSRPSSFSFDHLTPDGYQFFLDLGPLRNVNAQYFKKEVPMWNDVVAHGNYDAFWQARNVAPHLKSVRAAVMSVGGWFDAEDLYGTLKTFRTIEANNTQKQNMLVLGPWTHCSWRGGDVASIGPVAIGPTAGQFFRDNIEFPFFEHHLKGVGNQQPQKAWVYATGANRWCEFDAWPPRPSRQTSFFLHENGRLSTNPPNGKTSYDEYVSDPQKPVPFFDKIAFGMAPEYMVEDQRFAARRPDVLVYQADTLEKDLTISGPIEAELHVSTSGTDSDWIVKVIDVYPDDYPDPNPNPTGVRMGGYQQLVRAEVMRGKFRNSYEKPEPFVSNQPTPIKFALNDICHTFRKGHRLMVQVQSTWFPLVDRNPQTFVDIYTAGPSDFQKATERIYHTADRPSRVTMHVLPEETSKP
jgi:putative CocE/NonD family hydrolase